MNKTNNKSWILIVTLFAFFITLVFSIVSEVILSNFGIILGILIIILFILLGVIFDIIGVATATAYDSPFHAMASKKIRGSKTSIRLINNSEKVSSFCNDVIGDICGIMSGSAGLVVATGISNKFNFNNSLSILLVTSIIAALTIGGKALGKGYAMKYNDKIVYKVAKTLNMFKSR